jgi:hypothetical protein
MRGSYRGGQIRRAADNHHHFTHQLGRDLREHRSY